MRLHGAGHGWAVAVCVLITLAATPLAGRLDLTNIAMLYLAGVVGLAHAFGRGPATVSAVLNVAAFDFFFVPPRFTMAVVDGQYLLTFCVMLAVGLLIGQLTARLRQQARVAASREQRAQDLFDLTRELSGSLQVGQVAQQGEAAVRRQLGGVARVLVADADGLLPQLETAPMGFESAQAQRACNEGRALHPADAPAAPCWHYLPLQAPMRVRGVLALRPDRPDLMQVPEQRQHLETLARQVAIALERIHYVEVARKAEVQVESERLRHTLLATISHDVRTPLTALIGMAEQLQRSAPALSPDQGQMTQALTRQARALHAMVTKLLDMARLQSGEVQLRLEWGSVEEAVGAALRAAQPVIQGWPVLTRIPAGMPLVEFDAALMERALVNLLENAAKHGAPPIEIAARALPDQLEIEVLDHGAGLPQALEGNASRLFEKFTRGQPESTTPGVGLGLAICKAVVQAHRGTLSACNAEGAGAQFILRIPRRPAPSLPT